MVPDEILMLVMAATAFAKPAVDMVRAAAGEKLPGWASPPLAVLAAIGALLLLMVSQGTELTPQVIAQAILAGVLAGASSVGVTELQKHSNGPEKPPPTAVWATGEVSGPTLFKGGETPKGPAS